MSFINELTSLISTYSLENGSDTPDHVLAQYLCSCLQNFEKTISIRRIYEPSKQQQSAANENKYHENGELK